MTTTTTTTISELGAELLPGGDATCPAPPTEAEVETELQALEGKKVAVALSGGVDSAVAAHRLVSAGADVIGLALRLHDPDPDNPLAPRACCPADDLQDARRVAEQLGFPFYVLDGRSAFSDQVVRPFVNSYLAGRTPNPCVGCNAFVKLSRLHKRARALGYDRLATGHYARLLGSRLFRGADEGKDQSYFLFGTDPSILQDLVFPLGAWTKGRVREAALEAGLPVAHKLESQEVCFVGGAGAGRFVVRQALGRDRAEAYRGEIVDETGRVLGQHPGVMHYTVGQRKGLGLAAPHPLHVLSIDAEAKKVTVGSADRLLRFGLRARDPRWPAGRPAQPFQAKVRIRYRDPGTLATVVPEEEGVVVRFKSPVRAVSPGQAVVFYREQEVVGGAWIEGALD